MQTHSKCTFATPFVLSHTGTHTILSQNQNKMAVINEYPDVQTTLDPTINDIISLNYPFTAHIGSFSNISQNKKLLKTKVFISNLSMTNKSEFFHHSYFMIAKLLNHVIFT